MEDYNELNDKYLRLYAEFENYKKGIKRAKIKLSFAAGLFTALAWLVIYHWLNISN